MSIDLIEQPKTVSQSPFTGQRIEKWAAISGRWGFTDDAVQYTGPDEPGSIHPLGIALGAGRFRDGKISTRIKLSRTKDTTGGILLGFQSLDSAYLAVTIGGHDRAYAITEYRPRFGWVSLADAGSLRNIDVSKEHELQVHVNGQSVRMTVDEVDVLSVVLSRPIEGTGTGLYAWGDAAIQFTDVTVETEAPRIFVIMPFAEPFDSLYHDVILPVADRLGFEIIRVDEIPGPGIILSDIQTQIEQAHAVVAEISAHNPNVFYELGYAHALRKPAVLLVRRDESGQMPFDVRGYRAIFYDDTIGGKKHVERTLDQHLRAIIKTS
jgi:hypothetical protein